MARKTKKDQKGEGLKMLTDPLAYFLESLFITFLQTIAFFIVAARYDKIQRRHEFLIKIHPFIFFTEAAFKRGYTEIDFRFEMVHHFNDMLSSNLYSKKQISGLLSSLDFMEKDMRQKEIIQKFEENRHLISIQYYKLENLKKWILF